MRTSERDFDLERIKQTLETRMKYPDPTITDGKLIIKTPYTQETIRNIKENDRTCPYCKGEGYSYNSSDIVKKDKKGKVHVVQVTEYKCRNGECESIWQVPSSIREISKLKASLYNYNHECVSMLGIVIIVIVLFLIIYSSMSISIGTGIV